MIDVGRQVGGYTIVRRIGRGGMGEVFLAQHRRVARTAAVKVLISDLSQNASVLERFFNEARATSVIKHPGIVEVFDCDVLEGQAFIVMEFLDGESLGGYVKRSGAAHQDLTFVLKMGMAVAEAVGAAHAKGIIHRDLKPDNVYLQLAADGDTSVTVKVLDFGIAKLMQPEAGHSHTSTGIMMGTPAYMSPEQCRGAGRVDVRSDIYSLGCILYETICGVPPFTGEGVGDFIVAHVSEVPVPPSARIAGLHPAVDALLLPMLAKKPEERPQTMDEVVTTLRSCIGAVGAESSLPLRPRVPVLRTLTAADRLSAQVLVSPSHPSLEPEVGPVGGTQFLEPKAPTTLGSAIGELPLASAGRPTTTRRRKVVVAVGGTVVALAGLLLAGRFYGARNPSVEAERVGSRAGHRSLVRADGSASAPVVQPAPSLTTAPSATPPGRKDPSAPSPSVTRDVVAIDILGIPAGSEVMVDGRLSTLPVEFARGPESHNIEVQGPDGTRHAFKVDATHDRLIELKRALSPALGSTSGPRPAHENASISARASTPPSNRHPATPGAKAPPVTSKKRSTGFSERRAITDI